MNISYSVDQTEEEKQLQRKCVETFSEFLFALKKRDHEVIRSLTSPDLFLQITGGEHFYSAIMEGKHFYDAKDDSSSLANENHCITFSRNPKTRSISENEIVYSADIFLSNGYAESYIVFEKQSDKKNTFVINRTIEPMTWRQAEFNYDMMYDEWTAVFKKQLREAGIFGIALIQIKSFHLLLRQ